MINILSFLMIPNVAAQLGAMHGVEGIIATAQTLHQGLPGYFFALFGSSQGIQSTWCFVPALWLCVMTAPYDRKIQNSDLVRGHATRVWLGNVGYGLVGKIIARRLIVHAPQGIEVKSGEVRGAGIPHIELYLPGHFFDPSPNTHALNETLRCAFMVLHCFSVLILASLLFPRDESESVRRIFRRMRTKVRLDHDGDEHACRSQMKTRTAPTNRRREPVHHWSFSNGTLKTPLASASPMWLFPASSGPCG